MEKSYVSLEQKLDPITGEIHDYNCGLIMDERLRKKFHRNTITGYGYSEKTEKMLNDGYVACIEVSNKNIFDQKTMKQEEASRTGRIAWIRKKVADQMFTDKRIKTMAFVDTEVFNYLESLSTGV